MQKYEFITKLNEQVVSTTVTKKVRNVNAPIIEVAWIITTDSTEWDPSAVTRL